MSSEPLHNDALITFHGAEVAPEGGWPATFLVICYRSQETVVDALKGALLQTVPCEIIVSDDASGDEGMARVRAHLQDYRGPHRVVVRTTPVNLGLCAHMDGLAQLASSDILFNSAGDDVSKPERVAAILAEFAAHPEAMIVGSQTDDINAAGEVIGAGARGLPPEVDQQWLIDRGKLSTILGATMAIRRSVFADMPPLQGKVEDNMLMLRGALLGKCRCLQDALILYRRHENNLGDWVFDRSERGFEGWARRQRRVADMYLEIADDQARCLAARTDLPAERRALGAQLEAMYRLEAQQRIAMIEQPRSAWLAPIWQGLKTRGLRRKSAERLLKLFLPRSAFGK